MGRLDTPSMSGDRDGDIHLPLPLASPRSVRYGYRRVHVLLKLEGWEVNPKRTYKLYRELGLQLRNNTPKRRVKAKLREDRQETTLTFVDAFTRHALAAEPNFGYRAADVIEAIERVGREIDFPETLRVGQGNAISISRPIRVVRFSRSRGPGSRQTTRFTESFDGKFDARGIVTAHSGA